LEDQGHHHLKKEVDVPVVEKEVDVPVVAVEKGILEVVRIVVIKREDICQQDYWEKRKAHDGSQSTKNNNNKQRRKSGPANAGSGSTTEPRNNNRRELPPRTNDTLVRGANRLR